MPVSDDDVALILSALKFAAHQHRCGKRKGKDAIPYINHPIDVAELLWKEAKVRDPVTIAGALLHDTIEDTDTSYDKIKDLFGKDVADLVAEVTDDKRLPKAERKRLQVVNAPHKSLRASQLKLADKISNIRDISVSPPDDWDEERKDDYLDWAQKVVEGLHPESPELKSLFDRTIAEVRESLRQPAKH